MAWEKNWNPFVEFTTYDRRRVSLNVDSIIRVRENFADKTTSIYVSDEDIETVTQSYDEVMILLNQKF